MSSALSKLALALIKGGDERDVLDRLGNTALGVAGVRAVVLHVGNHDPARQWSGPSANQPGASPSAVYRASSPGSSLPCTLVLWGVGLPTEPRDGWSDFMEAFTASIQRIENEQAMAQAANRAIADNHSKDIFLTQISEELGTALHGVVGMTDLLIDTGLDDDQIDLAEAASASAQRLISLAGDVMNLARTQVVSPAMPTSWFDVRDVLDDAVSRHIMDMNKEGVSLVVDVDTSVPSRLNGDASRLRHIVLQLLGRLLAKGSFHRIDIRLSPANEHSGDDKKNLLLELLGRRIARTAAAQYRDKVGKAQDSEFAIARHLCQQLDGDLVVLNELRDLTIRANFRFPNSTTNVAPPLSDPSPAERASGPRALVIARGRPRSASLESRLEHSGFTPTSAASLSEARRTLRAAAAARHPFALVLVDQQSLTEDENQKDSLFDTAGNETIFVLLRAQFDHDEARALTAAGFLYRLSSPLSQRALTAFVRRHPQLLSRVRCKPVDSPLAGMKVLLAEDNPINRRVLGQILRQYGCNVSLAHNGDEAVEKVQRDDFDAILMDCSMQRLGGLEATRRIRALEGPIGRMPIIALTTLATVDDRVQWARAGMNGFLAKPIVCCDLERALATALTTRWRIIDAA